jgi:oxaloacetate decarboxylase beta subunit
MEGLFIGFTAITWKQLLMMAVGGVLIYLAIKKEYEPALLLPIGFGTILVNIPYSSVLDQIEGGQRIAGALSIFFRAGILTEIFPLLIFVAIGAMIDFSPLFRKPMLLLFGAAAQFGIFFTMMAATLFGFSLKEAAAPASSARPTAPPPSTWPAASPATCWAPFRWRPILTCPWCPSSSRR